MLLQLDTAQVRLDCSPLVIRQNVQKQIGFASVRGEHALLFSLKQAGARVVSQPPAPAILQTLPVMARNIGHVGQSTSRLRAHILRNSDRFKRNDIVAGMLTDDMPRYFFHLHTSQARDSEGEDFADDEAARQEAIAVARDLGRNALVTSQERVIVTNENGDVIHEEPLVRH